MCVALKMTGLVVVNVSAQLPWTHFHVLLSFAILLGQVGNHDALSAILMDVDKVCAHAVTYVHDCCCYPEMIIVSILIGSGI